jgi:ribosomal protein S18 acetylase RimI-like enzyme
MISGMRAAASSIAVRISQAEDAFTEAGAEVTQLDIGRVIRLRAFPHVYDANLVRRACLRPSGLDRSLERLEAPLREVGARHLQLCLDGADVPDSLAPLLRQRGFLRDRLLAMAIEGAPCGEERPDFRLVEAAREDVFVRFAAAMDRLNREEPWYAPSVSREIVGSMRLRAETGLATLFLGESEGRAVGTIGVGLHHRVASIFSVGTLPDERRRGVGRSLVISAVRWARRRGAELIYLLARADDSPQELYRKIGFTGVFGFDVWLRLP